VIRVNVAALYTAIDAARAARGILWSDVADQAGVSASTLSRVGRGKRPDVDGFAALVQWLGVPAERFFTATPSGRPPELEVQVALVLSDQPDLLPSDREFLHTVLSASIKRIREDYR